MSRQLVVEADGGSRGNPGPAAYGAVVTAGDGTVLRELAEAIGTATNNVAEYRGLLAGLAAAHAIDPAAEVEARLDSRLVVEQMSGRWRIKDDELAALAQRVRAAHTPGLVRYSWVPREQNVRADRLLNEALDGRAIPDPGSAPTPSGPPTGDPTVLLMVRHGESPLTKDRRFSGAGGVDPGLTGLGQEQARRAGTGFARRLSVMRSGIDHVGTGDGSSLASGPLTVLVSPLLRTRETAEVLLVEMARAMQAAALDPPTVDLQVEPDLVECAFGAWDGLTFAEAAERDPEAFSRWLGDPWVAPPGGEPLASVAERVRRVRSRLVAEHPGRLLLIVTHATPIRASVADVLGGPLQSLFRIDIRPGQMADLALWPTGPELLWGLNSLPAD